MLIGAPPQRAAKYDGDQSMPFQYRAAKSGRSSRSKRLNTPFRLLTSEDRLGYISSLAGNPARSRTRTPTGAAATSLRGFGIAAKAIAKIPIAAIRQFSSIAFV